MRRVIFISIFLLVIAALRAGPVLPVRAQAGSAADLIAAVNALRTANGLPPYAVDGGLMATAQAHSDYQASIGTATHLRADGTQPQDLGFIENLCAGFNRSVENVVSGCWQDDLHLSTLIGISSGRVGAGVAIVDNVTYYTLDVRRTGGDVASTPHAPSQGGGASGSTLIPGSSAFIMQVETVAPAADGSIIHEVKPGQSAWSVAIAYHIKIADLIALNRLAATPMLFAGQKLVIRRSFTATISPTLTRTPRPPTQTPTPTRTARPPTSTPTLTPTVTPTVFSLINFIPPLPSIARKYIGMGMIVICGIGLALVLAGSFRKNNH